MSSISRKKSRKSPIMRRSPFKSLLSRLLYSSVGFGIIMGLALPFYAGFFVEWKPGMYLWFSIGAVIASTIIGVINYTLVNNIIIVPLRQVRWVAKCVSEKDLTAKCDIESNDVIGDISDSVNAMLTSFEAIVKKVSTQASSVSTSSLSISNLTNEVLEKAINQQTESRNSSQQISDMLERVTIINTNAIDAANNASDTEVSASEGGEELRKSMKSIIGLAEELDHASSTMATLEKRSDSVGEVVKVISGIAEQTNLLALNAAIEAARAGEQGRGFAVVADEVRTLASRTRDSTQEIQSMIEELQKETKHAVSTMQTAKETAHHNTETVSSVAEKLLTIINSVKNIAETNREIESSSTKQKSSNETVNASVTNIMEMSDTVVDNANKSLSEINTLIHLTGDLEALVCDFKLNGKA